VPAIKERQPALRDSVPVRAGHLFDPGGRRTLDDVVTASIENTSEGRSAACPVCGERLLSGTRGAALACSGCGSRLE
jgi:DNA-directed RNA polymerase subunit RPC12/RpoP